jgi:hypothetical protein
MVPEKRDVVERLQMNHEQVETVKHIIDGAAVLVAGATFAGLIPSVAAMFTIVWTGMRIYEMVYGVPFSQSLIARLISGKEKQ